MPQWRLAAPNAVVRDVRDVALAVVRDVRDVALAVVRDVVRDVR